MMSKSHFWVVCDAAAYIKNYGTDEQKRALQTFQIAYGEKVPVESIAPSKSALEQLVGFESTHTDKFGDLAFTFRVFPGRAKSNVTGLGFHMFTAFNHFINPYPAAEGPWPTAGGYSYSTSSMKGADSIVVRGISSLVHGVVDVDNSLVLDRIRSFWNEDPEQWNENFQVHISGTRFAPWNVLCQFYYRHLIRNHYEPLEVRGPNNYIVGLQLLGPVVHASADACSVQHVRSTLGFGHSVWENYLKSKVYNRQINVNARLVSEFLAQEPFEPSPTIPDGPLQGRFDVGRFVCGLSARTARRLEESTSQTWAKLWKAGDKFWRGYLLGAAMREDAQYLYNMAVAGTVHCIEESFKDLMREGVLSPDGGLLNPEKMPTIDRIQKDIPLVASKKTGPDDRPSEEMMPVPYSDVKDVLGFEPVGKTDLQGLLQKVDWLFAAGLGPELDTRRLNSLCKDIEKSLLDQYRSMEQRAGDAFCPLKAVEKLPLDSELSAHWGRGTFRPPSSDECDDPRLLERYMDLTDAHVYKAHKLELTQLVAGLQFYRMKFAAQPDAVQQIDQAISQLERARGFGEDDLAAEAFEASFSRAAEKAKSARPREAAEASERRSFFEAVQEWLSPLFNVPVAALATVAAAVLVLVIVFPRGEVMGPVMGLSSEQWEKPGMVLMAPKIVTPKEPVDEAAKPKLAIIVTYKDFKQPPAQDMIDSSYKALRPTFAMRKQFDVVTPLVIKEAAERGFIDPKNMTKTLESLGQNLGVSKALVVTVSPKKDLFDVESELKDLATGQVRKNPPVSAVKQADLSKALQESVAGYFTGNGR